MMNGMAHSLDVGVTALLPLFISAIDIVASGEWAL